MVSAHSTTSMRCPSALAAAPAHTALLPATRGMHVQHTKAAMIASNCSGHAVCSSGIGWIPGISFMPQPLAHVTVHCSCTVPAVQCPAGLPVEVTRH